jgi:hypothetical protein
VRDVEQEREMRRGTTLRELRGREVLPAIVGARGFRHDQEQIALAERLMPLEPGIGTPKIGKVVCAP